MIKAEIITIGDELLIGQTIDTNSVYISRQLSNFGIETIHKAAISDNQDAIIQELDIALKRSDIIIFTGGLGPTKDDITKNTLAHYFKSGWRTDEGVLNHLIEIFKDRGRDLLETNKMQAELPDNCITLTNAVGTAPGMLFRHHVKWIVAMPGVPSEVEYIVEKSLIPLLQIEFNIPSLNRKTLLTLLEPESGLSRRLESFESSIKSKCSLAYLPHQNSVKLRLNQTDPELTNEQFEFFWQQLQMELGDSVFSLGDISPAGYIISTLKKQNLTIGTAESCTGGFVANQLVQVSGASDVFWGSVISYHNEVKMQQLNVPQEEILQHGAVSTEVALSMVNGLCQKWNLDVGISTTGIAGPNGGTAEKPVGLVYVAVRIKDKTWVKKYHVRGNRIQFMERTSNCAFYLLKQKLKEMGLI
jgi:nicotinamide-nucleotide amidase